MMRARGTAHHLFRTPLNKKQPPTIKATARSATGTRGSVSSLGLDNGAATPARADDGQNSEHAATAAAATDAAVKTTSSTRPSLGRVVLDAPGVVSSIREREVKSPAPMRIVIGGRGGGGWAGWSGARGGGAVGKNGRSSGSARVATIGEGGRASVTTSVLGGFPAVRHRSEMGFVKLGGLGAASKGR